MTDYSKGTTSTALLPTLTNEGLLKAINEIKRFPPMPGKVIAHESIVAKMKDSLPRGRDYFAGIDVVSSPYCYEKKQTKFPRSKKKRIIKKWAKRAKNFEEIPSAFIVNAKRLMNESLDNMALAALTLPKLNKED